MLSFVLDTSVLRDNSAIRGSVFEGFKAAAASDEFEVIVPEVVVRELAAHLAAEVEVIEGKIRRFRRTSAFAGTIDWLDHDELGIREIRDALRERFSEVGFIIEPVPAIDHAAVLDRLHSGLKPFGRDESEVGYRDYLIWRSALNSARRGEIVLVTNNSKDFASNRDPESVHEDLLPELGERSVRIRPTLHQAFEKDIKPRLESADRHQQWFEDWIELPDFANFLDEQLLETTFDGEVPPDDFDFPAELDQLVPQEIRKIHAAQVESVTKIDDDDIFVEIVMHADVEFGQALDPGLAEYVDSKFWDHFDAPEITIDPKYRYAAAAVILEGSATVAVVATTSEEAPKPYSAQIIDFGGPV